MTKYLSLLFLCLLFNPREAFAQFPQINEAGCIQYSGCTDRRGVRANGGITAVYDVNGNVLPLPNYPYFSTAPGAPTLTDFYNDLTALYGGAGYISGTINGSFCGACNSNIDEFLFLDVGIAIGSIEVGGKSGFILDVMRTSGCICSELHPAATVQVGVGPCEPTTFTWSLTNSTASVISNVAFRSSSCGLLPADGTGLVTNDLAVGAELTFTCEVCPFSDNVCGSGEVSDIGTASFDGTLCQPRTVSAPLPVYTGIGGTIYEDLNYNGTWDVGEPLVSDVTVTAYDCENNPVATMVTSDCGCFDLPVPAGLEVRLEFHPLPQGYCPAPVSCNLEGKDPEGNNVMCLTLGDFCGIDFGVTRCTPADDCSDLSEVNIYISTYGPRPQPAGRPPMITYTGPGTLCQTYADETASVTGNSLGNTYINQLVDIGTVWGTAAAPMNNAVYQSAFFKRRWPMGPAGSGAIYCTDLTAAPGPGNVTTLFDLAANGLLPESEGCGACSANREFDDTSTFVDSAGFNCVGKAGLGDLEITPDENTLYALNLHQKELLAIDLTAYHASGGTTPVTLGDVTRVPIPDPGCFESMFTNEPAPQDNRPFALKYWKGKLYVGTVCSAESSQLQDDLTFTVFEMDPVNYTFTAILSESFVGITKGQGQSNANAPSSCNQTNCQQWLPWTQDVSKYYDNCIPGGKNDPAINNVQVCYPQPVLTDIEFAPDGSMILGFSDRMGWQWDSEEMTSGFSFSDPRGRDTRAIGVPQGQYLYAHNDNCTYVLEDGGKVVDAAGGVVRTGTGVEVSPGVPYTLDGGPGGASFFDDGIVRFGDAGLGSLAIIPKRNEVVMTVVAPQDINSVGYQFSSLADGSVRAAYTAIPQLGGLNPPPNQSAALGDVEITCPKGGPIVEIGSRLWFDCDKDGIQDPCEPDVKGGGLGGIQIQLWDAAGATMIATTMSNVEGSYYFNSTMLPQLTAGVCYLIRIPVDQGALDGYTTTTADQGLNDLHDSDGTYMGSYFEAKADLTTCCVLHDVDFGFVWARAPMITCATATNDLGCILSTNDAAAFMSISITNMLCGDYSTNIMKTTFQTGCMFTVQQVITVSNVCATNVMDSFASCTQVVTYSVGSAITTGPPGFSTNAHHTCFVNDTANYASNLVYGLGACASNTMVTVTTTSSVGDPCAATGLLYTNFYQAVDGCNTTSSWTQVITVVNSSGPVFTNTLPTDFTTNCYTFDHADYIDGITNGFGMGSDDDGCDMGNLSVITSVMGDPCMPGGLLYSNVYTLTDLCANSTSHVQLITVLTTNQPMLMNAPADFSTDCSFSNDTYLAGLPAWMVMDGDLCETHAVTTITTMGGDVCAGGLLITNVFTVMDACAAKSVTQIITVASTASPVITNAPASFSTNCVNFDHAVWLSGLPAIGYTDSDVCDTHVATITTRSGGDLCAGGLIYTNTFIVTDPCGNSNVVVQTVTVTKDETVMVDFSAISNRSLSCVTYTAADNAASVAALAASIGLSGQACDNPVLTTNVSDNGGSSCVAPGLIFTNVYTVTDCFGSVSTSQVVIVLATAPLTLAGVPASTNIEGCVASYNNTSNLTATIMANDDDDCEITGVIVTTTNRGSGCIADPVVIENVWTATNLCGDVAIATQLVTLTDSALPVLSGCLSDTNITCVEEIDLVGLRTQVIASDACGAPLQVTINTNFSGEFPGCVGNPRFISFTWTAVSGCDVTNQCIQTYTIVATNVVILTCSPDYTTNCIENVVAPQASASSSGSCIPVVPVWASSTTNNGTGCPSSPIMITNIIFATDNCQQDICTQVITVVDTEAVGLLNIPADVSVSCVSNVVITPLSQLDIYGGGCSLASASLLTVTNGGSGCFGNPMFVTTTYTVSNTCNATSYVQVITVESTETPALAGVPANVIVACISNVFITPLSALQPSGGGCGPLSVSMSSVTNGGSGCATDPLNITNVYTVTSDCTSTSYVQVIVVAGMEMLMLSSVPADQALGCGEPIHIVPADQLSEAGTGCNPATLSLVSTTNGSGCVADPTVVENMYIATGDCGSFAVTQTITVADTEVPTFNCPDGISVSNASEAACKMIMPDLRPVATEGCSTVTVTQVPAPGTVITNIGITMVTLTAKDFCGNITSCMVVAELMCGTNSVVTTNDMTNTVAIFDLALSSVSSAPSVTTPGSNVDFIITLTNQGDIAATNVMVTDYLPTGLILNDSDWTLVGANAEITLVGALVAGGTTNVTITLMVDATFPGGAITNWLEISEDNSLVPDIDSIPDAINFSHAGESAGLSFGATGDEDDHGSGTVTVILQMDCPSAAVSVSCSSDVTVFSAADFMNDAVCGSITVSMTAMTNDGNGCASSPIEITQTYTLIDTCGTTTCIRVVTVSDEGLPMILTCPPSINLTCSDAIPDADETGFVAQTTGCTGLTYSFDTVEHDGTCPEVRVIEYVYTATDACGNSVSCSQLVRVLDQAPPTIACPSSFSLTLDPDCSMVMPQINPVAVSDDCAANVTVVQSPVAGSPINSDAITEVILTATDDCGQSTSCAVPLIYTCTVDIGGLVWNDLNNNGDPNDENLASTGFSDVQVEIRTSPTGAVIYTAVTGVNGAWNYEVPAGLYYVSVADASITNTMIMFSTNAAAQGVITASCCDLPAVGALSFGYVAAPTAIDLLHFGAEVTTNGVAITWVNQAETYVLGYNLYRNGEQINQALILAGAGAYSLLDTDAAGGAYTLESIGINLASETEGPILPILAAEPIGEPTETIVAEDGTVSFTSQESVASYFVLQFGEPPTVIDKTNQRILKGHVFESDGNYGVYFSPQSSVVIRVE